MLAIYYPAVGEFNSLKSEQFSAPTQVKFLVCIGMLQCVNSGKQNSSVCRSTAIDFKHNNKNTSIDVGNSPRITAYFRALYNHMQEVGLQVLKILILPGKI